MFVRNLQLDIGMDICNLYYFIDGLVTLNLDPRKICSPRKIRSPRTNISEEPQNIWTYPVPPSMRASVPLSKLESH